MTCKAVLGAALAMPPEWPVAAQDSDDSRANALQMRMYCRSFVQDDAVCRQSVVMQDGTVIFVGAVTG